MCMDVALQITIVFCWVFEQMKDELTSVFAFKQIERIMTLIGAGIESTTQHASSSGNTPHGFFCLYFYINLYQKYIFNV